MQIARFYSSLGKIPPLRVGMRIPRPKIDKELGREVKVGEGMANLPEVIKRLKEVGYTGNYIIEREISGDQQTADIIDTIALLRTLI